VDLLSCTVEELTSWAVPATGAVEFRSQAAGSDGRAGFAAANASKTSAEACQQLVKGEPTVDLPSQSAAALPVVDAAIAGSASQATAGTLAVPLFPASRPASRGGVKRCMGEGSGTKKGGNSFASSAATCKAVKDAHVHWAMPARDAAGQTTLMPNRFEQLGQAADTVPVCVRVELLVMPNAADGPMTDGDKPGQQGGSSDSRVLISLIPVIELPPPSAEVLGRSGEQCAANCLGALADPDQRRIAGELQPMHGPGQAPACAVLEQSPELERTGLMVQHPASDCQLPLPTALIKPGRARQRPTLAHKTVAPMAVQPTGAPDPCKSLATRPSHTAVEFKRARQRGRVATMSLVVAAQQFIEAADPSDGQGAAGQMMAAVCSQEQIQTGPVSSTFQGNIVSAGRSATLWIAAQCDLQHKLAVVVAPSTSGNGVSAKEAGQTGIAGAGPGLNQACTAAAGTKAGASPLVDGDKVDVGHCGDIYFLGQVASVPPPPMTWVQSALQPATEPDACVVTTGTSLLALCEARHRAAVSAAGDVAPYFNHPPAAEPPSPGKMAETMKRGRGSKTSTSPPSAVVNVAPSLPGGMVAGFESAQPELIPPPRGNSRFAKHSIQAADQAVSLPSAPTSLPRGKRQVQPSVRLARLMSFDVGKASSRARPSLKSVSGKGNAAKPTWPHPNHSAAHPVSSNDAATLPGYPGVAAVDVVQHSDRPGAPTAKLHVVVGSLLTKKKLSRTTFQQHQAAYHMPSSQQRHSARGRVPKRAWDGGTLEAMSALAAPASRAYAAHLPTEEHEAANASGEELCYAGAGPTWGQLCRAASSLGAQKVADLSSRPPRCQRLPLFYIVDVLRERGRLAAIARDVLPLDGTCATQPGTSPGPSLSSQPHATLPDCEALDGLNATSEAGPDLKRLKRRRAVTRCGRTKPPNTTVGAWLPITAGGPAQRHESDVTDRQSLAVPTIQAAVVRAPAILNGETAALSAPMTSWQGLKRAYERLLRCGVPDNRVMVLHDIFLIGSRCPQHVVLDVLVVGSTSRHESCCGERPTSS
jgi:hypothetical protein